MALRFEVLGFAGAAPLHGACPCYLLSNGASTVLLDCGPGTLERLWRSRRLREIDAIVVSHMHADHILDLVLLAGELVCSLRGERSLALYVPRGDGPEVLRRLDGAFAREQGAQTRFDAAFDVREYGVQDRVSIGALRFRFAATAHSQPCFAARVSDGSTVVVYGADGSPSAAVLELAAGADLLVLEATFLEDESAAAAQGHMTAAQAGELAARAGAARLLLTHTLARTPGEQLVARAAGAFGGPVELAREGYRYEP